MAYLVLYGGGGVVASCLYRGAGFVACCVHFSHPLLARPTGRPHQFILQKGTRFRAFMDRNQASVDYVDHCTVVDVIDDA